MGGKYTRKLNSKRMGKILDILGNDQIGLTIADVAAKIPAERATAIRYMLRMKEEGILCERRVGAARVFYKSENGKK